MDKQKSDQRFWIIIFFFALLVPVIVFALHPHPAVILRGDMHRAGPEGMYPPPATTGALNKYVDQGHLQETVCKPNWTNLIRPPASYTNQLKIQQLHGLGYIKPNPKEFEEDHLISLVLGGSPTDPANLWPQPYPAARAKDKLESYLHRKVCNGQMSLKEAQLKISQDWYLAYLEAGLGQDLGASELVDQDDE